MSGNINIRCGFTRKTFSVFLVALVGFSLSAGGAMAGICRGGIDCFICAAEAHPHLPAADANVGDSGCQPVGQKETCGVETGTRSTKINQIVTSAQFSNFQIAGIFIAAYDDPYHAQLYRTRIALLQHPERSELTPVYLLNQSLIC